MHFQEDIDRLFFLQKEAMKSETVNNYIYQLFMYQLFIYRPLNLQNCNNGNKITLLLSII